MEAGVARDAAGEGNAFLAVERSVAGKGRDVLGDGPD
jgi:hypothetical protein